MQPLMDRLDCMNASSRVGLIFFVLSRIVHVSGRVIVKFNALFPFDACTYEW